MLLFHGKGAQGGSGRGGKDEKLRGSKNNNKSPHPAQKEQQKTLVASYD